jgi:ribA/ribD-fused uncharacterized protein
MIDRFDGTFRFLSNFWPARVFLDGEEYPTIEHAYQAAKTLDLEERPLVRLAATPGRAKRLGQRLTLREDWEAVKLVVMLDLLRQKFARHSLTVALLATGEMELVEGNAWGDTFWGVDTHKGGANHLGRLLMQVRAELRGAK